MDCNVTINKNNCKFDLINQEGIKKEILSINTDYLLKFDYNKMLLNVFDPLLYCKIQFEIFDNKSLKRIDNKILTLDNLEKS